MTGLIHPILALVFGPLLRGIINRTKAFFAGRQGPPFLQPYYDLIKLLKKGAVYSETTTWVFLSGPVAGLAICIICLFFLPFGNLPASFHFQGDLIFVVYLLGLMRFFTVLAAMDTGSAFEGMGASREMTFSALAEPTMLFGLAAVARKAGSFSLSPLMHEITPGAWMSSAPTLAMVIAGLFLVFLAENSRIPVDDPNTHLELTMIHEVMILDHSGVDLGFIEYAASLKLWILGSLLIGLAVPIRSGTPAIDLLAMFAGMVLLAVVVGIIESTMARFRMSMVPLFLVGACVFSIIGFIIQ